MNLLPMLVFSLLIVLGTGGTIRERDPFAKLISLSLIAAGVIPFVVDRGYLDVAIALALIVPLSTFFLLMACRRDRT